MKCDEVKLLLVSLADGALRERESQVVQAHVVTCASCRQESELLKADAELLRRDVRPEVPAYLATRIMAEVRARQHQARPWFGLSPSLARIAAVVLVVVGVWVGTILGQGLVSSRPSLRNRLAQMESEASNRGPDPGEER